MGWAVLAIVAGLAAVDLLVRALIVLLILRIFERKIDFRIEPSPPNPGAEEVSFPTSNGLVLRGSLHRRRGRPLRGLVIFCPEFGGSHWSASQYCAGLLQAGFDVLSFDFRNQGDSDRMPGYDPLHWLTEYEVEDVLAAVAYSRQRPDLQDLPLGLMGISRGAGAALAAAAVCRDVRGVACEGAFSTESLLLHYTLRWASLYIPNWLLKLFPLWHVRLTLAMAKKASEVRRGCRYTRLERLAQRMPPKPVLMISGARDTYVQPDITAVLCRKLGQRCREFWVVPAARHNMARTVDPAGYDRRLVELFSAVAATSPQPVLEPQPQS